MSVFRVITRIIPLNANETSFEPVSFETLTNGISKRVNVLNMVEPQSGVTYRIERIEDIQHVGPGETIESVNNDFAEKLKSIPGFVQLKENDMQTNLSDKSFQLSLPQVVSLNKDAISNENPNSFTISLVQNKTRSSKSLGVLKKNKKESKKKNKADNENEFSSYKKESKKKQNRANEDTEFSNDKNESKKKCQTIDDTEPLNEKKESKKKQRAKDDTASLNEKKELKKERKASEGTESSKDKKESKKKHRTVDNTWSLNDKKESKRKHKSDNETFSSHKEESYKRYKVIDSTDFPKALHKSKSLTLKKSLKMKYKLGKKIKIFRKSPSPLKIKHNKTNSSLDQSCKSSNTSIIVTSQSTEDCKDSDTKPASLKSPEHELEKCLEKCELFNESETKNDDDKSSVIKVKNVALDDSSYDTECGELVINMPEAIDSNIQQIDNSNNKCDKFNDAVTPDSDLSSLLPPKGNTSTIENVIGEDSNTTDSYQTSSESSFYISLDNTYSKFAVSVEHPFFELLQPLKKYFVSGECLICGYIPEDVDYNAADHMETHISSNSSFCFYKCICCTEQFCSPRNLYMHALSREKSYKYMCDICLLKFKRKHYLLRHNAKSHSSSKVNTNSQ